MALKPLGDRVVVEPIEQDEITAGGITEARVEWEIAVYSELVGDITDPVATLISEDVTTG